MKTSMVNTCRELHQQLTESSRFIHAFNPDFNKFKCYSHGFCFIYPPNFIFFSRNSEQHRCRLMSISHARLPLLFAFEGVINTNRAQLMHKLAFICSSLSQTQNCSRSFTRTAETNSIPNIPVQYRPGCAVTMLAIEIIKNNTFIFVLSFYCNLLVF